MDAANFFPRFLGQQVVVNRDFYFRADAGRAGQEGVEGIDYAAMNAVLDRYQTVIDMAADDFLEDDRDIGQRDMFDATAEFSRPRAMWEKEPLGPRNPMRSGRSMPGK